VEAIDGWRRSSRFRLGHLRRRWLHARADPRDVARIARETNLEPAHLTCVGRRAPRSTRSCEIIAARASAISSHCARFSRGPDAPYVAARRLRDHRGSRRSDQAHRRFPGPSPPIRRSIHRARRCCTTSKHSSARSTRARTGDHPILFRQCRLSPLLDVAAARDQDPDRAGHRAVQNFKQTPASPSATEPACHLALRAFDGLDDDPPPAASSRRRCARSR